MNLKLNSVVYLVIEDMEVNKCTFCGGSGNLQIRGKDKTKQFIVCPRCSGYGIKRDSKIIYRIIKGFVKESNQQIRITEGKPITQTGWWMCFPENPAYNCWVKKLGCKGCGFPVNMFRTLREATKYWNKLNKEQK